MHTYCYFLYYQSLVLHPKIYSYFRNVSLLAQLDEMFYFCINLQIYNSNFKYASDNECR